jgi:uncharacterized repeat protein (TIGR01451 family)
VDHTAAAGTNVISDTASVSGANEALINTSDESATQQTSIQGHADLSITNTGPATGLAGNNITYTFTLSNAGPSDAQSVKLADMLPAGETFVSQGQTGGPAALLTHPGNQVSDTIATLPAGASATFVVTAQVKANAPLHALLNNTATVSSTTTDPNLRNNSSTAGTTVLSNLTVSQTLTSSVIYAGGNIVYAITLTNLGATTVTGLQFRDVLPTGTQFVSATVNHLSVALTNLGALAGGHSETVMLTLKVLPRTKAGTALANKLTIRDALAGAEDLVINALLPSFVSPLPISSRWLPGPPN